MRPIHKLAEFAPPFVPDKYSVAERECLQPFFTNLDQPVSVPLGLAPEIIGALCSRASRASGDLRQIFSDEYLQPFLNPSPDKKGNGRHQAKQNAYSDEIRAFVNFLRQHPITAIFSNPRARSFYIKWLAQYGDDSIAQMAGTHVLFSGISQLAIKHFEDQRIGLAPIEKSTRYVDYSSKIGGHYRYYTDPSLADYGLREEYVAAMDGLFVTYINLLPKLNRYLAQQFPREKQNVIEKKSFDTLRGLLPLSTLSQVAFFGNGQAFEYMIARSARHSLGEIRWAVAAACAELYQVVPSFLRRLKDPNTRATAVSYQRYLASKPTRLAPLAKKYVSPAYLVASDQPYAVKLIEYDPQGENKVLAGMLYSAAGNHATWQECLATVNRMSASQKETVIDHYLAGRDQRWQKVGRAFENTYLRFEIEMDIGAWRDLQRHRMLTQQRQDFTCRHGYVTPPEVEAAGLTKQYQSAINQAEDIYAKLAKYDPILAQYAVTLAHKIRFMQWKNIRECFWEMELRTIPAGHPSYRLVEQTMFKQFARAFPLVARYMRVNLGNYDFARRGQAEKIQEKLKQLATIKE